MPGWCWLPVAPWRCAPWPDGQDGHREFQRVGRLQQPVEVFDLGTGGRSAGRAHPASPAGAWRRRNATVSSQSGFVVRRLTSWHRRRRRWDIAAASGIATIRSRSSRSPRRQRLPSGSSVCASGLPVASGGKIHSLTTSPNLNHTLSETRQSAIGPNHWIISLRTVCLSWFNVWRRSAQRVRRINRGRALLAASTDQLEQDRRRLARSQGSRMKR